MNDAPLGYLFPMQGPVLRDAGEMLAVGSTVDMARFPLFPAGR